MNVFFQALFVYILCVTSFQLFFSILQLFVTNETYNYIKSNTEYCIDIAIDITVEFIFPCIFIYVLYCHL